MRAFRETWGKRHTPFITLHSGPAVEWPERRHATMVRENVDLFGAP